MESLDVDGMQAQWCEAMEIGVMKLAIEQKEGTDGMLCRGVNWEEDGDLVLEW